MSEKIIFEFPNGYKIEKKESVVDRKTAYQILASDKQKKYTCAKKSNAKIMLTQHIIICPVCGYRMPDYPQYTNNWLQQFISESTKIPKNIIKQWCEDISDSAKNIINLNFISQPLIKTICYVCPECYSKSEKFSTSVHCELNYARHKLSISRRIDNIKDLTSIRWFKGTIEVNLPIYEELTFNFKNGHTFVRLRDANMHEITTYDVTYKKEILEESFFSQSLKYNKRIIRFAKKIFIREWRSDLPFETVELDLTKFMLLTEFIGYPKIFYYSIPYENGTYNTYILFKSKGKALHRAQWIKDQYKNISWIKSKQIKKLVFSNPAFLFYENECSALSEIFGDINVFYSVLCMYNIFHLLSAIHETPHILCFLRDYADTKGEKVTKRKISLWKYSSYQYALHYSCMSDTAKAYERSQWKNGFLLEDRYYKNKTSSIVYSDSIMIPYCTINGFHFFQLNSDSDYLRAGHALRNCLGSYRELFLIDHASVVCVSKGEKIVAAIEICNNLITQASSYSDGPIEYDSHLYKAYTLWREKYNLYESRNGLVY